MRKGIINILVLFFIVAGEVTGASYFVRPTEPAEGRGKRRPARYDFESPTIQAAIDAASDGDVVVLGRGVFRGEGNRDVDFLGKAVTVRSIDPNDPEVVAETIIDCQGDGRGFYLHSFEDNSSVIEGITITNGKAHKGGGILCEGASPIIKNCVITGNTADAYGGGIYHYYEDFPRDCAGIAAPYNIKIINCTIVNNSARSRHSMGGGILCYNANPKIQNCIIQANESRFLGGGILIMVSEQVEIKGCLISGNIANNYDGGGICLDYCLDVVIRGCTVTGNKGSYVGGIYCRTSKTNCAINDSIVQENRPIRGGFEWTQIYNPQGEVSFNCIQGGFSGKGNIDVDPCFVEAGYWDDNGTPDNIYDDFWVDGDYRLREESLCINAGDPNYIAEVNETDLAGNPRVIGERIDMGAYEFEPIIEAPMKIEPQVVNLNSKGKWIKARFAASEEFWPDEVNLEKGAVLEPFGIVSQQIKVFEKKGETAVEVDFERGAFCDAAEAGEVDVGVKVWLKDGFIIKGSDRVRVIDKK